MIIKYGILDNYIDVTQICYEQMLHGNTIVIPHNDNVRASYFTDPILNVPKFVYLIDETTYTVKEFDLNYTVFIDTNTDTVSATCFIDSTDSINDKLDAIHQPLQIKYGVLTEELNEQKMAVRYLTGEEKILEIGGNIGRNSLVIASILREKNSSDLVVLESDPNTAILLTENRDLNNMQFHIESSALSKRKLIQSGWRTIESEEVLEGYIPVKTITYREIVEKYNIKFDTLILDCEGAFYYILQDMPEILENIQLIIVENDYLDVSHKEYIDGVLRGNGFFVDYVESGGWGPDTPCYHNFYEVWKRVPTI